MNIYVDVKELLDNSSNVDDEIFSGFQKGTLGTVLLPDDSDNNLVGLAIATCVAGANNQLYEIFDSEEKPPAQVLYISIGATEAIISKALQSILENASVKEKKLANKNLRVQILSPGLSPQELKQQIQDSLSDDFRPKLIVMNAATYINSRIELYEFPVPFTTALLTLAHDTKTAILVLKEQTEKNLLTKKTVSWRSSIDKTKSQNASENQFSFSTYPDNKKQTKEIVIENGNMWLAEEHVKDKFPYSDSNNDLWTEEIPDENISETNNIQKSPEKMTMSNSPEIASTSSSGNKTLPVPTHVFIRHANAYEGESGKGEFDRILESLPLGKGIPLATFSGGTEKLADIQKAMDTEFPWLSKITAWVLQCLRGRIYFAEQSKTQAVITLPPILLVGPPGIGKTEWAADFAGLLGLPFDTFSFAGASSSVEYISSLSRWWKKPKPSRILSFVAACGVANPLFLLDEIDKQNTEDRYGTAQQALLSYLDRNASYMYDDFLEGHIDVTSLNMIATANNLLKIDEPLRSRFEVIETPRPKPEHASPIFARMHKRFVKEMGTTPDKVPFLNAGLETVEKGLHAKKDLRSVWVDVKAFYLKELTGVDSTLPSAEKMAFGFIKDRNND